VRLLNSSYWIFSVTPKNWQIARKGKVWAARRESITQKVKKGDFVVLYVNSTRSFCSIIQILENWSHSTQAIWSDEIEEGGIKYPYRVKVEIVLEGLAEVRSLLPRLSFIKNKKLWGVFVLGTPANLRRPIPESDYNTIYEAMKSNPLPQDITSLFKTKPEPRRKVAISITQPKGAVPRHNEVRDMIMEIGKIEGKISEVEYPIDNLRLDVVWKTISTGNPKWAFEVQMAGNFYEALTKLKHAWDKWNSKPFLVTNDQYMAQAKSLLEGSFHEMKDDARIVNWEKVVKLHQLLKEAYQIKTEIRF